ncbi:peroxiredoxin [bacterium]|nr:MAG: peroxiredoxin [bacterium]
MSSLQEGQAAPEFSASDDQGHSVRLQDFKGKKNVVLYFYPKDDTPGCTIEACNFRDAYAQFQTKDTQILGVSFDDAASHQAFKQKFHLSFPLLVDSDRKIAQAYGVQGDKYPSRDTILIGKDGKILKIFRKVDPAGHAGEILNLLGEK